MLTELKNVACIKTVQKTSKGTVTTIGMSSPDVPGGVVYQTTKELDPAGPLLRRSTLQIADVTAPGQRKSASAFLAANGRWRGRKATY